MAQYDKLINLGLLSQFLTKAKTIFAPKITASGILKGDGAGGVTAATADTDYATFGLGLTGASVGDLVRVNAVDADGKPTSWKHVPLNEIKCNKNLLDNWYFVGGGSQLGDGVFPINQRGQTSYSNAEYTIDRWKINTDATVNIATGIVVTNTVSTSRKQISQFCKDQSNLYGETVTASILLSSGEMYYGTNTLPASPPSDTLKHLDFANFSNNTIRLDVSTSGLVQFVLVVGKESSVSVLAMKLELGSEQTLAHNEGTEANPVWVLNEIPDYGEELRKCQTSRADSADAYANQEIATINRNPGAHNSIYRGKYLGSTVTAEQYAAIGAGTFDDLYIGDYWTIGGVNYRIAAFDYWLNSGAINCTTHHIVIVPDTNLYKAQMNTSDVVTGAYVGSQMYTTNLAQAKTTINNAFGSAHILNHKEFLSNAVNDSFESSGAWYDSTVELMTGQMVYGGKIFVQNTIDKSQLPLFALEPSRISNRNTWWLRDVATSARFAFVANDGYSGANDSSRSYGVRPAFGICA